MAKDIDIMVSGMSGKEFAEYVARYQKEVLGEEAKTVGVVEARPEQSKHLETAILNLYGTPVDFVSPRVETYSEDSRIPIIESATAEQDAFRRDLTINSLFYNLKTGRVEDYTGQGLEDLKNRVIRTPNKPEEGIDSKYIFLQDPLRILRAIRFATRLGFNIDPELMKAAKDPDVQEALKKKISRERVQEELRKMLTGPKPKEALELIKELGLHSYILQLPQEYKDWDMDQENPHHYFNLWGHILETLGNLQRIMKDKNVNDADKFVVNLAAFLHDVGKLDPKVQGIKELEGKVVKTYHGHEESSIAAAEHMLRLLPGTRVEEIERIKKLIHAARNVNPERKDESVAADLSRKALGNFVRNIGDDWEYAIDIAMADAAAHRKDGLEGFNPVYYQSMKEQIKNLGLESAHKIAPILSGDELKAMFSRKPGKWIGILTKELIQWQLENRDATKEMATQKAKELYESMQLSKMSSISKRADDLLDKSQRAYDYFVSGEDEKNPDIDYKMADDLSPYDFFEESFMTHFKLLKRFPGTAKRKAQEIGLDALKATNNEVYAMVVRLFPELAVLNKTAIIKISKRKSKKHSSAGIFIVAPKHIAKQCPSLGEHDDSKPHITALFIGEVPTNKRETIKKIVKDILSEQKPFDVEFDDKVTYFPASKHSDDCKIAKMKILSDDIHAFNKKLKKALVDGGVEVANHFPTYKPHLTLEYMEPPKEKYDGDVPSGSWTVDCVEIWGCGDKAKIRFGNKLSKRANKEETYTETKMVELWHGVKDSKSLKEMEGSYYLTPNPKEPKEYRKLWFAPAWSEENKRLALNYADYALVKVKVPFEYERVKIVEDDGTTSVRTLEHKPAESGWERSYQVQEWYLYDGVLKLSPDQVEIFSKKEAAITISKRAKSKLHLSSKSGLSSYASEIEIPPKMKESAMTQLKLCIVDYLTDKIQEDFAEFELQLDFSDSKYKQIFEHYKPFRDYIRVLLELNNNDAGGTFTPSTIRVRNPIKAYKSRLLDRIKNADNKDGTTIMNNAVELTIKALWTTLAHELTHLMQYHMSWAYNELKDSSMARYLGVPRFYEEKNYHKYGPKSDYQEEHKKEFLRDHTLSDNEFFSNLAGFKAELVAQINDNAITIEEVQAVKNKFDGLQYVPLSGMRGLPEYAQKWLVKQRIDETLNRGGILEILKEDQMKYRKMQKELYKIISNEMEKRFGKKEAAMLISKRASDNPFKVCSCGKVYETIDDYLELPLAGSKVGGKRKSDPDEEASIQCGKMFGKDYEFDIVYRNCSCLSTLAVKMPCRHIEQPAKDKISKRKKKRKDILPGGLADKMQPSDFNKKQLQKGVKTELEHTKNKNLALEIAMDHLMEDPKYYTKLEKMEKRASIVLVNLNKFERLMEDKVKDILSDEDQQTIKENIDAVVNPTKASAQQMADRISAAISKIRNWNNSKVTIFPNMPFGDDYDWFDNRFAGKPVTSFHIYVGKADFTYLSDDTFGDVLDVGDDEMFSSNEEQKDYFALLQAMQNKVQSNKPLVLYTARPVKDREKFYELANQKQWPSGIFLTDSYSFAKGFGNDYGEDRDIWRVRVLENNVLLDDSGSVGHKQYQLYSGGSLVDIVLAELVYMGSEKSVSKRANKLKEYKKKRDFDATKEPEGKIGIEENKHRFVIQKHDADKAGLHFDLRLENDDGTMTSFAIPKHRLPKGKERLLAQQTEDHPIEYNKFEGKIEEGYGKGHVDIHDSGKYELIEWKRDTIKFKLNGKKEKGHYTLHKTDGKKWLLMVAVID